MAWVARILFAIAALIAALLVEHDALNFSVIQMLVSVILITAMLGAASFWSMRRHVRDAADYRS